MLYIIRHGKTDWNVRHKLQGRTDIPLNEEGRQMAEAAREEYRDVHFDICFCSPLIRARETADILLRGRDIPIITDDRLMEMSFGSFEGIENSFQIPDCPVNELFFNPDQYIANLTDGAWCGFKYFGLQNPAEISATIRSNGNGTLIVSTERNGEPLAELPVSPCGDWRKTTANALRSVKGVHALYFRFAGDGAIDFKSFSLK